MARVLLLGAGLVTRPLVKYLLGQPGLQLSSAVARSPRPKRC